MRKLSICIPTFNRVDMTIESFLDVMSDERIESIVVVDDASDLDAFNELKSICDFLPKVSLFRNLTNQNCYANKMIAASYAKSDYIILLDSDNIIQTDYLDAIFEQDWNEDTILAPVFARTMFDYRAFSGLLIDKENVVQYIDKPMFQTALNTANYFIHKESYLHTFDPNFNPVTADSIYINYLWLKNKGKIKFVEGMEYEHKIHNGSHYINNVHRTPNGLNEEIVQKIRNLNKS